MLMHLIGFLAFDKKSREFKKFRKELKESAETEIRISSIDANRLFIVVSRGIRNQSIRPSRSYGDISPDFIKLSQVILEFPSKVGAFLSTLVFGTYLLRNGLSLWGQGEIMLVYESMFHVDSKKAEKAAELMAYAFYMMDHRFIAHDTYIHMLDPKMRELTKRKLQQININLSEIIIRG